MNSTLAYTSAIMFVLVMLGLAMVPHNPAFFGSGNRLVIIREDDVQDYGFQAFAQAQQTLLQYQLTQRIPTLLSIIAADFGGNSDLVDTVKEGLRLGIFAAGIHGWQHVPFTNLSPSDQASAMQRAKLKLEQLLGVNISTFIPPYNVFDDGTINALKINALTIMSAATYVGGDYPREEDGIIYIPETVETAEVNLQTSNWGVTSFNSITQEITNSWNNYGISIITFHPRQFLGANNTWSQDRWQIYLQTIDWVKTNQGTLILAEPQTLRKEGAKQTNDTQQVLALAGVFAGITSISAFKLRRGKRNLKETEDPRQVVD